MKIYRSDKRFGWRALFCLILLFFLGYLFFLILLTNKENIEQIAIFDIKGSLIFSKSYQLNNTSINVSDFEKGVYIVKIISKENSSVQQLIIE